MDKKMILVPVVALLLAAALFFVYRSRFQKTSSVAVKVDDSQDKAQAEIERLRTEKERQTGVTTGSWSGKGTNAGRTSEISITSGDDGTIKEATVVLRSGTEGVVAGFQYDPKAESLLRELMASYDPVKKTFEANLSFLRYDSWAPPGVRTYRALEGIERLPKKNPADIADMSMFVDYLVLESTDPDTLIQAGVSRKGLLMFLNGSHKYATEMERGHDIMSKFIHPGKEQEITHFQDLIFNFSGGLNFVSGRVDCAVASPLAPAEGMALSLQKQP